MTNRTIKFGDIFRVIGPSGEITGRLSLEQIVPLSIATWHNDRETLTRHFKEYSRKPPTVIIR